MMHHQFTRAKEHTATRTDAQSFEQEPDIDFSARPLGVSSFASYLPGIVPVLRAYLARALRRRLVEPRRRYFDMQRHYLNRRARQVRRAPGGAAARKAGTDSGQLRPLVAPRTACSAQWPPHATPKPPPAGWGPRGTAGRRAAVRLQPGSCGSRRAAQQCSCSCWAAAGRGPRCSPRCRRGGGGGPRRVLRAALGAGGAPHTARVWGPRPGGRREGGCYTHLLPCGRGDLAVSRLLCV